MRPFTYLRPTALTDAAAALAAGARPLAGGTDLLPLMKADIERPHRLVDVKRLPELTGGVHSDADGSVIGALTTLAEIERHAGLRATHTALVQAVAASASQQLRNMATLAGNLLQQPRCAYFRHPDVHCWRKGGDECPARDGEHRLHAVFGDGLCCAVHPSDPAVALVALDAQLRIAQGGEEREIPVEQLFAMPAADDRREVRLEPGALVTSVRVPAAAGPSLYLKAMDRHAWSFALVSVAAHAQRQAGDIVGARIVLGGVAPIPWRAAAAEQAFVDGAAPGAVAEAALQGATPLRHNGFKLPLIRALVARAVESLRNASA